MFKVGPNPYGICTTLGIQGKASYPRDVEWYVGFAESIGARCIEFHFGHLVQADPEFLSALGGRLRAASIEPVMGGPGPLGRLAEAFPLAKQLGVRTLRAHLSPVLCGARAAQGDKWGDIVQGIRKDLVEVGPRVVDEGLVLAIENHQDFGSDELLEFCELGGSGVGITLDTGNPLAVAEEPIAFAKKVAHKVRHVHLKDYRAQATPEGYRLVRCAIGDGAIPFDEICKILSQHRDGLTASLEPGALEARHVKLLTPEWWNGYAPRSESEKRVSLPASRINAIPPGDNWMTPWERGADSDTVAKFEMDQMMKSVQNMQAMGWLPA